MITTQKQLRRQFFQDNPHVNRKRIVSYSGRGRMYTTDTRCAFTDYVDHLCRSGMISEDLAFRATLNEED